MRAVGWLLAGLTWVWLVVWLWQSAGCSAASPC